MSIPVARLPLLVDLILVTASVVLSVTSASASEPPPAEGVFPNLIRVDCVVFHDLDEDGVREAGEPGLPGVSITNGVEISETDAQGELTVWVDRDLYRFATMTIPPGFWPTTSWYHWVPVEMSGPTVAEFGLKSHPETASDPIRWVHISDTQTRSWGQDPDVESDLAVINELLEPPLFLVNTGDLVETASDTTHWNHYLEQISLSNYPVFTVPGNHDTAPTPTPHGYYERFAGPPYYNHRFGSWSLLFVNDSHAAVGTPAQSSWLDNVVASTPSGVRHIVFEHRPLAGMTDAYNTKLVNWGVEACFSGHWHCLQISRVKGILDVNLSRTSMGPLDRTPRSFAIVTLTGGGEIEYELRRLGVDHRAEIAHPQPDHALGGDHLEVLVQAYDSSFPVTTLTAELTGAGSIPPVALTQEGVSLWRAMIDVSPLPPGTYELAIHGSFDDGSPIEVQTSFERAQEVSIVRAPVEDWPMFRESAAGSSFAATAVDPPLELAWSTPLPGMVALSSPVVADGRVFLGCRTETDDLAHSGVICCDAISGRIEWFSPLPGGIALAPAVWGDVVLASAMTDSVFGLDSRTGNVVWSVDAPGSKYKMTAPIHDGNDAWVGGEPSALEIDPGSGQVHWTSGLLGSSWYPKMYSAPAVNDEYVYFGFYGTPGSPPDGFSVVDRQTGAVVHHENGTYRSPICAGETVYVVMREPNGHVLTARDRLGNVLWIASTPLGISTGAPALGHGIIVLPGADGRIEALAASDGTHLWTHQGGWSLYDMRPNRRDQRDAIGAVAIADRIVYAGSLDGHLYALDLDTGAELWRWYLGTPVASSPAVSGNMLFVGASDGHLYAFVESASTPAVGSPDVGRASHFAFYAPTPNPSVADVRLEWAMPAKGRVVIDIFDVTGRRVRRLLEDERDAGEYSVRWDGLGPTGTDVGAGVYLARLKAGENTACRKLVRLRR